MWMLQAIPVIVLYCHWSDNLIELLCMLWKKRPKFWGNRGIAFCQILKYKTSLFHDNPSKNLIFALCRSWTLTVETWLQPWMKTTSFASNASSLNSCNLLEFAENREIWVKRRGGTNSIYLWMNCALWCPVTTERWTKLQCLSQQ